MLSLTHSLISLPFGIYLQNPFLIFVGALLLHLFADTLLHWNIYPERWGKLFYPLAAIDVVGGVVLAWVIMGDTFFTWPILLAIAGGNTPDVLHGLWDIAGPRMQRSKLRWVNPLFDFHDKIQLETVRPALGLIWQIIAITIVLILI